MFAEFLGDVGLEIVGLAWAVEVVGVGESIVALGGDSRIVNSLELRDQSCGIAEGGGV